LNLTNLTKELTSGMISEEELREYFEMKLRREMLAKHPYAIKQGKDCRWTTYVVDEAKKDGRRQIRKSSEEGMIEFLVTYYQEKEMTFKAMYFDWRRIHDLGVSENTIYKYETDYKRFFEGTEFEKMKISIIEEEDIQIFLIKAIKEHSLPPKSASRLYWYINQVMTRARKKKWIYCDPLEFLQPKQFYSQCKYNVRTVEEETFSIEEIGRLRNLLEEHSKKNPKYMPNYAVEFAIYTGMRVGEISALKWSDVSSDYILIRDSEIYNRKSKDYALKGTTKTGKARRFPLTSDLKELLDRVRQIQEEHGYLCEWVFAGENGRIHKNVISSCIKNRCRMLGINERGIKAFRKTLNSILHENGASVSMVASMLGHSEDVNRQHYTYDISNLGQKRNLLENAYIDLRVSS